MQQFDLMKSRHSVRQYAERPIEDTALSVLRAEIEKCNKESGLRIQLVTNEPKAFDGFMAHYGKFSGVTNYIALIGKKGKELEEKCGYYGERLVLSAQALGLNTCWVAMSYSKVSGAYQVEKGEKLVIVIALGYGKTQGTAHKTKAPNEVSNLGANTPAWFKDGVTAALLAPTAMNQQRFYLSYADGNVTASAGRGFYSKIDLGIVKYHFELGAGKENFRWG